MEAGSALNEFCCSWKKEFLQSLHERRNGQTPNGTWNLEILWSYKKQIPSGMIGRYVESWKGFVQSVRLKIGSVDQAGRNNIVNRPVSKVVLLLESEKLMKTCSNPRQGSHKLNAMWFLDTTYLEGEPCINAMHCSGMHLWKILWGTTILRILNFIVFQN